MALCPRERVEPDLRLPKSALCWVVKIARAIPFLGPLWTSVPLYPPATTEVGLPPPRPGLWALELALQRPLSPQSLSLCPAAASPGRPQWRSSQVPSGKGQPWQSPLFQAEGHTAFRPGTQEAGWMAEAGTSLLGKAWTFLYLATSLCPEPHLQASQLLGGKDQLPVASITRAPLSCLLPTPLHLSPHG